MAFPGQGRVGANCLPAANRLQRKTRRGLKGGLRYQRQPQGSDEHMAEVVLESSEARRPVGRREK